MASQKSFLRQLNINVPILNFAFYSLTEQSESHKKLELTKTKVDEVVDIMRQNVEKIVERGHNLTEVDQRSEALRQSALQFQDRSEKLQRKHWLANIKMRIALGVVGVILIVVIVGRMHFVYFAMKIINFVFNFSFDYLWMIENQ